MRVKYILRAGEVGEDPDAWILGVYFTRSGEKGKLGLMTIGGPGRFRDVIDEILTVYFGIVHGIEEGSMVTERQKDRKRKRFVFDVGPLTFISYLRAVKDMMRDGISATRVRSTGRLMR